MVIRPSATVTMHAHHLYDEDFYAWTQTQARELRRFAQPAEPAARPPPSRPRDRRLGAGAAEHAPQLDRAHHRASTAPGARAYGRAEAGWADEIGTFRRDVELRMTATLERDLKRQLPRLYAHARSHLESKLELFGETETAARLPETCPYTLDQILGPWWPEHR